MALLWLRTIMFEKNPSITLENNTAAILIREGKVSSAGRIKHVDMKFQWLKMAIKKNFFFICYVSAAVNYSDGLMKSLAALGFQQFVRMCLEKKIICNETIGGWMFVTINKSDSFTSVSRRLVVTNGNGKHLVSLVQVRLLLRGFPSFVFLTNKCCFG